MILRKPYAFLIKHFRLIHLILAVLVCYSIYRTKILLDFFNEYAMDMINVVGQDLQSSLIPTLYLIVPVFVIIFALIILFVLSLKKKPNLFYLITILVYIFVIIVVSVASSTLETMSINLVDVRTIRLVRDFVVLAFSAQFICAPIVIIRTVGFDVKKFNFKEDLKELEISEEDREEFEVELNIDKNKLKRDIRRTLRYLKYSYKENKLLYNIAISTVVVSIFGYTSFTIFVKPPTIGYNTTFAGNGFTLSVLDSYLVNTDYQGNLISEDNSYLLVRIKVRNNLENDEGLDTATTKIVMGNYYFVPMMDFHEKFIDFGKLYMNEKIGKEYEEKVLVYQIPNEILDKEMIFSYVNKNGFNSKEGFKSTNVLLENKELNGVSSNEKFMLGQTLHFDKSILTDFKITITGFEISNNIKIKYNHCISKECFESYEYLKPTLNTNYEKTLLKINGKLEKESYVKGVSDLYDFIEKFGKIRYEKDGVLKLKNVTFSEVISTKVKKQDVYYIEIPKEIEKSEHISLVFVVRDRIYEYVLK